MRAILISRVSTEEQKEAGNSLPAQIARLEKYCQSKGFTILKSFSFDESAYKLDRLEFDRILDFVLEQKDKVAVCCDKVDRLSRNMFDKRISLLYEKSLQDEIELHFVSEGQIVTSRISAAEKFQFTISLGLAKYYSDSVSDSVKRAIEGKLRKGEFPGKAPFGYKNITITEDMTDIIVDEQNAYIIQHTFEQYATGAYSLQTLCAYIKEKFSVKWKVNTLHKMLNNPFYYGVMIVKGQEYPHRYPPLIVQQLFDQVKHVKERFNKKPHKYAGKPYIYRGLIQCHECGSAITPEKHKGHVYYHCTQYRGKHDAQWIREEALTEQLSVIFKQLQCPEEFIAQTIATLKETHHNKVDFHKRNFNVLIQRQTELTGMIDKLYMDKLKGSISDEQYNRYYGMLRNESDDIARRLSNLQTAEDSYYITATYILDLTQRAHQLFVSSEVEQKRKLIKLVLQNLTLDGKNLRYIAQKPFDILLATADHTLWRPQVDAFRNHEIEIGVTLQHLQTVYESFGIQPKYQ